LTTENYEEEFPQVNAQFTEKPQVSPLPLPFAARVAGLQPPAARGGASAVLPGVAL